MIPEDLQHKPARELAQDIERLQAELAEKSEQLLHIDNACWYCANPDIEDPWRHEHEPNGAHWHHCVDPGDGLPSDCANSERLERIFAEKEKELEQAKERERQLLLDLEALGKALNVGESANTRLQKVLTKLKVLIKPGFAPNRQALEIIEAALTVPPAQPDDEKEAWLDGRASVKPAKEKP